MGGRPHPGQGWTREPVATLLTQLDPQYRVEGINDDGEVDPDWAKVARFAARMRAGEWDLDGDPITLVVSSRDRMVFDGNHRVLAASQAGVTHLLAARTSRPLGGR